MGEMVARLVGKHMRLWGDNILIKDPGVPGTAWHQDFPHSLFDRRGAVGVWVAIEDATVDMGTVQHLPRSHRLAPVHGGYNTFTNDKVAPDGFAHFLREDDWEIVGDVEKHSLTAGEAVIHDSLLLHGTGPNLTTRVRRAVDLLYFPADAYYNGNPRPEMEGLGMKPYDSFDIPRFPIVG